MIVNSGFIARPVDGVGTNTTNTNWGAAGSDLLRLAGDSRTETGGMAGQDRPGAREISNIVAAQTGNTSNENGVSDFLWIWGQFLDHDLSLTESVGGEQANIAVPLGDPLMDPTGTGAAIIPFTRVQASETGGYHNEITSYIDASMIYGSDIETLTTMRTDGGKLVMTEENQLELEGANLLTGDTRAAENVALSSMHTIFTREHNRVVEELAAADPSLTADALFDAARAQVEGLVQAITYNDFLPILLGSDALGAYSGYDDTVNVGISVEFSTAVYRFGHTLLSSELAKVAEDGTDTGELALRDAFFRPSLLDEPDMIEDIVRGAATQESQALDTMVVEDVRSFLFGAPGAGGFDLAALNIQRGRDLGVDSYNDLRDALGLDRAESFDDITSNSEIAGRLQAAYGDVDLVDAWVGGLAEDALDGAMLGETFSIVMIDQFTRLRAGDPFWSESRPDLTDTDREEIWNTSLSDVILRNTDVEALQDDVFFAMNRITGTDSRDKLKGTKDADFIFGADGRDKLWGRNGDDDLQGGAGNDVLHGNKGDDRLEGGTGQDKLIGGRGDDVLIGGEGHDVFKFNARHRDDDIITDFEVGVDCIMVRNPGRKALQTEQIDEDVVLSARSGWTLTLENVDLDELTGVDYLFTW